MRDDMNHYIRIRGKHGRLCHEVYKVLSHLEYDLNDEHSKTIPHNCIFENILIKLQVMHLGYMTKESREKKRNHYLKLAETQNFDDSGTLTAEWLEEDLSKLTIEDYRLFDWDKVNNEEQNK